MTLIEVYIATQTGGTVVFVDDDEAAVLTMPDGSVYRADFGSDDDDFCFVRADGTVIRVPFPEDV